MATSCEAVAYADISGVFCLSENRIYAKKLGYMLLDMAGRSVLEVWAFSIVTAMWFNTASQARPVTSPSRISVRTCRFLLPILYVFAMILLLISSVAVSVDLWRNGDDDITEFGWHVSLYRGQVLIESVAWALHCSVVIECIHLTAERITLVAGGWWRHPSMSAKTLLPMVASSLCYALRSGWLLYQYTGIDSQIEVDPTKATDRFGWAWWIGFCWAPTLIVVFSLLYSARKRDNQTDLVEPAIGDPLLLQSPVPPAEAFLAFSRHRFSGDPGDDSLFGSPMFHIIRTDDVEVADEETLSTYSEAEPS